LLLNNILHCMRGGLGFVQGTFRPLVRYEVFTAVRRMMMMLFWVLAPCRLVGRCQRFGETYCFHLQSWRGAKTQKNSHNNFASLFES
jgi:hypothetical protein